MPHAKQSDVKSVLIRIPLDVDEWFRRQAERNYSNRNTEIVRVFRDAMDAEQRGKAAG